MMHVSLKGRVALVTGGGRGIGRAIALSLAEAGADIAVNYRRDEGAAKETVAAIEKLGRKARAYSASVENWDEDVAMVADVIRDFGSIGILVNNAGIASRGSRSPRPIRQRWSASCACTPSRRTICASWSFRTCARKSAATSS